MRRITYCSGLTMAMLGLMAGVEEPAQAAPMFSFTSLNVPFAGAYDIEAYGINGMGQIVGFYDNASGGHGFLKAEHYPQPSFDVNHYR